MHIYIYTARFPLKYKGPIDNKASFVFENPESESKQFLGKHNRTGFLEASCLAETCLQLPVC